MDFEQHKYRGFSIKFINGGSSWRAVIYDSLKKGTDESDHHALTGFGDKSIALKKCHDYIDDCIRKEMERWCFITMGDPNEASGG